jgi:SAM-dependent methyltransferase
MAPLVLGSPFTPAAGASRMGNHGDLAEARRRYLERPTRNLRHLLRRRYEWLNEHIDPAHHDGVELAAGMGVARDHVRARSFQLTDVAHGDWLDLGGVDATATPFDDDQFDFVVIQNGIHHLAQPIRLFDEAARILRPGGVLLVQDVKCSLLQRALARLTRVEGYSYEVDVFDPDAILTDPASPWEANNAVPDLLFDDIDRFHREVPAFEVVSQRYGECLVFLNSGGVTHKTISIPLPAPGLALIDAIDRVLTRLAPSIFALQRSVVLRLRSERVAA